MTKRMELVAVYVLIIAMYTVGHKKLHLCYWYNNFTKLCRTMIIFGT